MQIEHCLPDGNLGKKKTPDLLLKAMSLSTLDGKYPSLEWISVYTDGSQVESTSGAKVFYDLFSKSAPVGKYMSNYVAEISAIDIALSELLKHGDSFSRAVILVDSSSATQSVTDNQSKETLILSRIRNSIRILYSLNKIIVIQWIPSHVGIEGTEKADALENHGTKLAQEGFPITIEALKKFAQGKELELQRGILSDHSKGKAWENIQRYWSNMCQKRRKEGFL